jgi:PIN domain nuclease of toxin-antitoxin system
MIVLDTCAIVFDALSPERLSARARDAIDGAETEGSLACSDISLWEVAMLINKGRLDPGADYLSFMRAVLAARGIRVLPITPEIAQLSVTLPSVVHKDPVDRIIAATTLHQGGVLVTSDDNLLQAAEVPTLW